MGILSERGLSFGEILTKYEDLPPLARWKALITEHGVDFKDPTLFNNLPNIELYKTKRRALKPVAKDLRVFDISQDPSLIPAEVVISEAQKASIVKLGYKPDSPIQIDVDEGHKVILREKESQKTIPINVDLVKRRNYQSIRVPKEVDTNEPKLSDFVDVVGLDRISVMTFDGCWNWNSGKPCRFCDYNPKRQEYVGAKPSTNTLSEFGGDADLWWNNQRERYLSGLKYAFGYLLANEDLNPHQHLLVMSGNLPQPQKVWENALEVVDTLNNVRSVNSFDNYLNICPHPSLDLLRKAKDKGINQVQYNLEVIGQDVFAQMCPGKMEYNTFRAKLEEAVGVMGFGNVRSNFVLGIQPIEDLLKGVSELADKGVVTDYSIFQPKRATALANHPAPSIDTIVHFTKELANIYREHGFRGIYCNLSSRSSIINECL